MAKADDLTGKTFGFLTVKSRAQNIIYGVQSKVAWMCECKCGNKKVVAAYDLKRGSVTSCRCRQTEEDKKRRNKKGCEPDSRGYRNVRSGLSGAKRAMLGKKYGCCTYTGWKVLPTHDDGVIETPSITKTE